MWEGYALIAAAFGVFVITYYTVLVSKLLPSTGNALLDAIQADEYYCLLLPATIPTFFFFVMFNWMSFKFFRHN